MTATRDITSVEDWRELLKAAVEARGREYVYESKEGCVYFDSVTRQPSCLIGHCLPKFGVDAQPFVDSYTLNGADVDGSTLWAAIEPMPSDSLLAALASAQEVQDRGGTWGEALDAFEEAL